MAFWITSDEKLMSRVQTMGDEAAFSELVHRWQARLEGLAYRVLHDSHRSQDLVQEAFSRLYTKRHQYKAKAAFSSYIWRITANLCQDELRRRRSRLRCFTESIADETQDSISTADPAPDSETERNEEAAVVRQALCSLPDQIRIIVVMRHYEDLKFREISEALGIPEGTVKTRMGQGLSMLAQKLNPILSQDSETRSLRSPNQAVL